MGLKLRLWLKKFLFPYQFKYLHASDEYLVEFYDELIELDMKLCHHRHANYVNYALFYKDYDMPTIFKFKNCLESMGLDIHIETYYPKNSTNAEGTIFIIYLDNLWQFV